MKYNPDIHHRHSVRLRNYNYANAGSYFVTICCQNRQHLFGNVVDGKMILNDYGGIAENAWYDLPRHHSNVKLFEFIVMPNHVHGILGIGDDADFGEQGVVDLRCVGGLLGVANIQGVAGNAPTYDTDYTFNVRMSDISPKSGTLSTIIRSYKSSVSKQINDHITTVGALPATPLKYATSTTPQYNEYRRMRCAPTGIWQRNYHEHVIRNEIEFAKIAEYIRNNPILWAEK